MSTGNTAPYHFTQPSTDNDVQIVLPNATMAIISCSLNITIPSNVIIFWRHNGSLVNLRPPNNATQTGNTTTLLIGNLQPSDAGVYQCVFNNPIPNGWVLRRNIRLITSMLVINLLKVTHFYCKCS